MWHVTCWSIAIFTHMKRIFSYIRRYCHLHTFETHFFIQYKKMQKIPVIVQFSWQGLLCTLRKITTYFQQIVVMFLPFWPTSIRKENFCPVLLVILLLQRNAQGTPLVFETRPTGTSSLSDQCPLNILDFFKPTMFTTEHKKNYLKLETLRLQLLYRHSQ